MSGGTFKTGCGEKRKGFCTSTFDSVEKFSMEREILQMMENLSLWMRSCFTLVAPTKSFHRIIVTFASPAKFFLFCGMKKAVTI
ncbi:MAG: hypothetical protein QG653_448 [Patescibacteria group bacterium]|nr:hypothetical protein [Patescibacteria group bacterium]